MRKELNDIEKIEQYLEGRMTGEDKLIFEAQMELDQDLKESVQTQKELIDRLAQQAFMAEVADYHAQHIDGQHNSGGKSGSGSSIGKWIGGIVLTAALATGGLWLATDNDQPAPSAVQTAEAPAAKQELATESSPITTTESHDEAPETEPELTAVSVPVVESEPAYDAEIVEDFTDEAIPQSIEIAETSKDLPVESPAERKEQLYAYLASQQEAPQEFKVTVSRDTVIEAVQGTTMEIPANAFVIKGTKELAENVNLQLSEYYSTSDILLANLSTTSNGHMLETAGMLHIVARDDQGRECELKDGKPIRLGFPVAEGDENPYQMFQIDEDSDDQKNWVVQGVLESEARPFEGNYHVLSEVDFNPAPLGGSKALRDNLQEIARVTRAEFDRGIEGTVIVQATIGPDGEPTNVFVRRGLSPDMDERAYRAVKYMNKWSAAVKGGDKVASVIELPVHFVASEDNITVPFKGNRIVQYELPRKEEVIRVREGHGMEPDVAFADGLEYQGAGYGFVDVAPKYLTEGDLPLEESLAEASKWYMPYSTLQTGSKKLIRVCALVGKEGQVEDAWINNGQWGESDNTAKRKSTKDQYLKGLQDKPLHKAALDVVYNMGKWQPGMVEGKPVASYVYLEVPFNPAELKARNKADMERYLETKEYTKRYEASLKSKNIDVRYFYVGAKRVAFFNNGEVKAEDGQALRTKTYQQDLATTKRQRRRKFLATATLGWLNFDCFNPRPRQKDLFLAPGQPELEAASFSCVFYNFNTVAPAKVNGNRIGFSGVPADQRVTIVGLTTKNDQLFLAHANTNTSKSKVPKMEFEPTTYDEVADFFDQLRPPSQVIYR